MCITVKCKLKFGTFWIDVITNNETISCKIEDFSLIKYTKDIPDATFYIYLKNNKKIVFHDIKQPQDFFYFLENMDVEDNNQFFVEASTISTV